MPADRPSMPLLEKLRRWALSAYDHSDFVTAQKAKVFVGLYLTSIVAGVAYMSMDAPERPVTVLVVAPGLAIAMLGFAVLRRGHFALASNGLLVGWLIITFAEMFLDPGPKVERLDTIAAVVGVVSLAPLTVRRRRTSVFLYFAVVLVVFGVYVLLESKKPDLADVSLVEYALDSSMGILICGVASYYLFAINKRALDQAAQSIALAEAEADKNRELSRTLEHKVEERTEQLNRANHVLEATNHELTRARDALWGEMELAKKIQTVLLPRNPRIRGCEIAVQMAPADEVGGDYYDVIPCERADWIVIGDVSGHGVQSGLVMMMVQTAIHAALQQDPNQRPSELLEWVNRSLARNLRQLGEAKYVTMTALAAKGDGRFAHAGLHQDILIRRQASGRVERVQTDGIWLGVTDEIRGLVADSELRLENEDTMLLYTDGLIEARRKGSVRPTRGLVPEMFGMDRLARVLEQHGHDSPEEVRRGILEELDHYDCRDDVTLVVIRRVT
jgi:serine phosphatase RsbU (regulator of sigma subunit)